jgi:hypothetical protein
VAAPAAPVPARAVWPAAGGAPAPAVVARPRRAVWPAEDVARVAAHRTTVQIVGPVGRSAVLEHGVRARVDIPEPARIEVRLRIRLPRLGRERTRTITAVAVGRTVDAGVHEVRVRPGAMARAALRLHHRRELQGEVLLELRPLDGSARRLRRSDAFWIG